MKYIYLYTTPTYKLKNWYKIGESTNHPKLRIKQQDNASNPEPLMLITFWKVNKNTSDKKIHSYLHKSGFNKIRGNREWFELSTNPEQDIESAILFLQNTIQKEQVLDPFISAIPVLDYKDIWWFKSEYIG